MIRVVEHFAHNLVLDEIVSFLDQGRRILRAEHFVPRSGACEVRLKLAAGSDVTIEVPRGIFETCWNEASAILTSVTDIECSGALTDGELDMLEPARRARGVEERKQLAAEARMIRGRTIDEAGKLFWSGMYEEFVKWFGPNCSDLSPVVEKKLELAKARCARDA